MKQEVLLGLNWTRLQELTKTNELYTYREMCKLLNLKTFSSGSKGQLQQLSELGMICEYEKVNRKYRFLKMRTQDEILLYNERTTFTALIEYCLSEKFLNLRQTDNPNYQNGILFFSTGMLLDWCGLVHKNYLKLQNNPNALNMKVAICFKYGLDLGHLSKFVNVGYTKILKPIIRSALKSMDNKMSITIHKGFKLHKTNKDGHRIFTNILATSEKGQILESIVANAYTYFGFKKIQDLIFLDNETRQDFYIYCNQQCQELLNYDGFFDCYAIVINEKRTKYNLEELRTELNQKSQTRFLESETMQDVPYKERQQLVDMLIDLQTDLNIDADVEEYYQYKITE